MSIQNLSTTDCDNASISRDNINVQKLTFQRNIYHYRSCHEEKRDVKTNANESETDCTDSDDELSNQLCYDESIEERTRIVLNGFIISRLAFV